MTYTPNYHPPAPTPPTLKGMMRRIFFSWQSDILHYLPVNTYDTYMSKAPVSKNRNIYVINDPKVIRHIMVDAVDNYPKSDLVTSSLKPLVGNSIFTVSGEIWKHQHRMIEEVFSKLRLNLVFETMQEAIKDYEKRLDSAIGKTIYLDEEMAFITADIIFRTMFSRPIQDDDAQLIFKEFTRYQESLPHMTGNVIFKKAAFSNPSIPARGKKAAQKIRDVIAKIIDDRLQKEPEKEDICQILLTCRDPETGTGFTREETIDQIAFFFLAGHETSASALTWSLLCLSQDEGAALNIITEVNEISKGDEISYAMINKMKFSSAVFKEALRLYPPVSFITRYALKKDTLRSYNINPDDLMVISPWTIHRNNRFWENPTLFDPTRFLNEKAKNMTKGSWLPFGVGPRVCTGATFANAEANLILGSLTRRYKFTPLNPEKVKPVSRLTVRTRKRLAAKITLR